jgi:hypothetical protein
VRDVSRGEIPVPSGGPVLRQAPSSYYLGLRKHLVSVPTSGHDAGLGREPTAAVKHSGGRGGASSQAGGKKNLGR